MLLTWEEQKAAELARYKREEEAAQVAWAALRALDPCEAERSELLASGVGGDRIRQLFPRRFEDQAAGVLQMLNARKSLDHLTLTGVLDMMRAYGREAVRIFNDRQLDLEFKRRWLSDKQIFEAPPRELRMLQGRLLELLAKWEEGGAISVNFVSLLWYAWWLMENRGAFKLEHQRTADRLMNLVANRLLPELVPDGLDGEDFPW